jgi:polyisoprenoid-binding protein YceI
MRSSILAAALAVTAMAGTTAQAATYNIDPTHTFVTFEVTHFGTSTNRGRFDKKEGVVQFDRAAKTGSVNLTIQADSINTGTEAFNAHLKKPDFFDAAKHPTMTFSADKFTFSGDKVSEVAGSLTMLGKTVPVVLKATNFNCYDHPMLKREVCGGDFETTITRSDWGMKWGIDFGIPDKVKLLIQVEAAKQ